MLNLGGGVHLVKLRMAHALLIEGPPMTLIDTGADGSLGHIIGAINASGSKVGDLEQIVITHAHFDHIGCAGEVAELTGARVMMHRWDASVASGERGPYMPSFSRVGGILFAPISSRMERFYRTAPCQIDRWLDDGDEIAPGIRIIGTPGHTPGHVSALIERIGLLHAGDALQHIIPGKVGPSFRQLNVDQGAAMRSIAKLGYFDFEKISFGHGKPILAGGADRVRRLARRLKETVT